MADALSATNITNIANYINSCEYNRLRELKAVVDARMTALSQVHNGSAAVAATEGEAWQMDQGSLIAWLNSIAATDAAAIVQLIQIEATIAARIAV